MEKLISVIVPVYNVEKYVEQCVRSIMSQTYKNLEIILVDDGAKDNSGAICDRLAEEDKRIRVIHKENGGVSSARNAGIDAAQGEWIAFVDGDDYIDSTMYEKLAAKMADDVDISFCCIQLDYEDGRIKTFLSEVKALAEVAEKPYDIVPILQWTRRVKRPNGKISFYMGAACYRSLFEREIIIRENVKFPEQVKMGEDRLFMMAYLSVCKKGALVEETLYHYRKGVEFSATAQAAGVLSQFDHEKRRYLLKCEIILKNKYYKKQEKDFLILHVGHEFYYTFMTALIRGSPDYKTQLKSIYKDEVVKKILKTLAVNKLRKTGYSFKEIIKIMIIKWRLWGVYKLLSK